MTAPDPVAIALQVASVFERLGVRYVLGGSLASTTFGEPRATLDVDFAADLEPRHVVDLVTALGSDFFTDGQWIAAEVQRRGSFQLVHRATMTRVDVFVPAWTDVHLWKWEQRRRVSLSTAAGGSIDVTAPEGIVVQKLRWFRDGGEVSDRQWRDVVGVLKLQGASLQLVELRNWAQRTRVADLLERALQQAGLTTG